MNQALINRIKQRVSLDSDEEIMRWIDEYATEFAREKCEEAVKLARYQMGDISGDVEPNPYTEQEILEKVKL